MNTIIVIRVLFLSLYIILSCTVVLSNIDAIMEAKTASTKNILLFIFIIFAPVFILVQLLENIIEILLYGQIDDDNNKFGGKS